METQERIKDRILRRASAFWGYTDTELETSFDPIVSLLLDACSSELEKLSAELNNSRTRVVERLLEIMSPESKTGTLPAHSIFHVKPIENNFKVSYNHQFDYEKLIPNIYDPLNPLQKKIFLGPTSEFILANADLSYMVFGDGMYSMTRSIHKDLISKGTKHLKPATMWLGITCDEHIESLEKLMFFTNLKNIHQRDIFYHYLRHAKIYLGDKEIPFKEGYNSENSDLDIEAIVNKNYNQINQHYLDVNKFYHNQFFHLTENIVIDQRAFEMPMEFQESFNSEKLKEIDNVMWIRIEFPEAMINEVLENAMFYINSFPVINKQLISVSQSVDPFINYIPLKTDDSFLDIKEITDTKGYKYHVKNFVDGNLNSGDATLRNSGVVRFDERNASEIIQYLLEVIKDERASFSMISGDFVQNTIKQMNQQIATLEQEVKKQKFESTNYPYVIIKTKNEGKNIIGNLFTITYWVTTGEYGNDVKPGTKFKPITANDYFEESSYLLLTSVGGKSRLPTQEKILAYRESLLTRGRVVTIADIKVFCQNHFKHSIVSVDVKKGTKKNASTNKGFERTIDIILERDYKKDLPIAEYEWQYLCDNLMHKLKNVSSNIYPYNLVVKPKENLNNA